MRKHLAAAITPDGNQSGPVAVQPVQTPERQQHCIGELGQLFQGAEHPAHAAVADIRIPKMREQGILVACVALAQRLERFRGNSFGALHQHGRTQVRTDDTKSGSAGMPSDTVSTS